MGYKNDTVFFDEGLRITLETDAYGIKNFVVKSQQLDLNVRVISGKSLFRIFLL